MPLDVVTPEPGNPTGLLADVHLGIRLPLQVLGSAAGYYLGTREDVGPVSRESVEYLPTTNAACHAFATGAWTQRQRP